MRRILALLLVCVTCFLCACDLEAVNEIVEESEPEPETETNEKGNTYLIMPISRKKVKLDEEYKEYLPYISYDLLRDAEEKIDGECGDNQNSGFYLGIDKEGYLAIEKEYPVVEYDGTVGLFKSGEYEITLTVWNFSIDRSAPMDTSFGVQREFLEMEHRSDDPDGLYKKYYDMLLYRYHICAYSLPFDNENGTFSASGIMDYVNNPRVVAFQPLGFSKELTAGNVSNAYNYLSQKQEWLDKSYFYLVDEPLNQGHLDQINQYGDLLKQHFPGYKMMAPEHVNYVWDKESKVDNFSYVVDSINVWCFKPYFFTTYEQAKYDRRLTYWMTPKLEANLGTFAERMYKEQAEGDELWWYVTRRPESPEITLLMETEAVRHRILFWQQKLYNVDSFLYYLVNDWYEMAENNGVNKKYEHTAGMDAYDCYGNGVLLYCGQDFDVYGGVESIRLETVRDGIEDFEYLTMITELYGKDVTDAIIHRLTTSLSNYNTDTDNFTDLRIALGNIIEATLAEQAK